MVCASCSADISTPVAHRTVHMVLCGASVLDQSAWTIASGLVVTISHTVGFCHKSLAHVSRQSHHAGYQPGYPMDSSAMLLSHRLKTKYGSPPLAPSFPLQHFQQPSRGLYNSQAEVANNIDMKLVWLSSLLCPESVLHLPMTAQLCQL